jgi:hypothetical protein
MKRLHIHDKTKWLKGPWNDEHDYEVWIDDATFYPCLMRRNQFAAWCGFVGVDQTHPLFLIGVDNPIWNSFNIHGEIGFAQFYTEADLEFDPPIKRWWIGFNTSHKSDFLPNPPKDSSKYSKNTKDITKYKNVEYTKRETLYLASQLKKIADDHDSDRTI